MVGRAAGHDAHLADVLDLLPGEGDVIQDDLSLPDAGGDGLAQGLGLLVDLLHHKVLIAALFRRVNVPLDALGLLLDGVQLLVVEGNGLPGEDGDLPVLQAVDVPGVGEDGGHIAGDEVLPLAHANDKGAILAHGEQLFRAVRAEDAQGIAAFYPGNDLLDGLQHIPCIVIFQQLGHHLGVRIRGELHPPAHQTVFQLQVVFDDAVVHHHELAPIADLRVGVYIAGGAVGGPPGVANAHCAGQAFASLQNALQHAQAPFGLDHMQAGTVVYRHTGGVIPPVLQLLQAV